MSAPLNLNAPLIPLTPREMEVLELGAEGLTGPETAEELGVGAETVKTHRQAVREKLAGAHNFTQAVTLGFCLGLFNVPEMGARVVRRIERQASE